MLQTLQGDRCLCAFAWQQHSLFPMLLQSPAHEFSRQVLFRASAVLSKTSIFGVVVVHVLLYRWNDDYKLTSLTFLCFYFHFTAMCF